MKRQNIFKRFKESERGTFSVEAVLMFPLLVWIFVAMFVFFEGLRESNINLKASYTVSDLLSREEDEEITMAYLNNMNNIYSWLSRSQNPVHLRVTVVRYDESTDSHFLVWSRGVNGKPDLTQTDVSNDVAAYVPIMADADVAIVVETWASYEPVFNIGIDQSDIYNVVVTAPRFAKQLKFEGIGAGGGTTHDDDTADDETDDPDTGTT